MGHGYKGTGADEGVNINKSDVPFPVLYGGVHIEMFSNAKLSLEGRYAILEYTTEMLKIKLNRQSLTITGTELSLCNVEKDAFLLTGKIMSIEFE